MAKCYKVKDIPNPNFDQTVDVFKWKNWKTFFKKKNLSILSIIKLSFAHEVHLKHLWTQSKDTLEAHKPFL